MSNLATLQVVVDPTQAMSGIAQLDAGFQKLIRQAQEIERAHKQMSGSLGTGFGSAVSAAEQMTSKMASMVAQLAAAAGAVLSLRSAFDFLSQSVKAASTLEDTTLQLAVLSGSFGKATEQLKLFQSFADRTQFKLGDVSQAGKIIQLFDGGTSSVQDLQKELTKLGDMASVAGRPLNDVAVIYERLKAGVREGGQIGDAARSLQEMGILAPAVVIQLQNAEKFGATAAARLNILEQAISRTSGATDRANKLYSAQSSTLVDQWGHVKEALGQPLMESLKPVLVEAADYMKGTIQPIAASVGKTLSGWVDTLNGAGVNGSLASALGGMVGNGLNTADSAIKKFINGAINDSVAGITAIMPKLAESFTAALMLGLQEGFAAIKVFMSDPGKFFAGVGGYLKQQLDDFDVAAKRTRDTVFGWFGGAGPQADAVAAKQPQGTDAMLGQARANYDKSVADLSQTIKQMFPALTAAVTGAANPLPSGNVPAGGSPAGYTPGARSYVFGRTMAGGVDMTDVGRFPGNEFNEHHGAYRGTDLTNPALLGAAVGPDQASALTGIANGIQAQTALMGRYLEIQLGSQSALVQIVDKAPAGHQGMELTPAAHRAVGDEVGNAAIGYRLAGNQEVGQMLKSQYYQGGEVRKAQAIDPALARLNASGAANFTTDAADLDRYNRTLTQLDSYLELSRKGMEGFNMTQAEHDRLLTDAQGKLVSSANAWQNLEGHISKAQLELAKWNDKSRQASQQMGLNQYGAGNSFQFGLQDAAKRQGTDDQQFAKLGADVYGTIGQSFTSVADSFIDNNGRMKQSFSEMTAQLLKDIAKLIINMLILRAVQQLIGLIPGGGGGGSGSFLTTPSSSAGSGIFGGSGTGYHDGGLVGLSAGSFTRQVPDALFYGTPRLHGGGYLQPGEVPAILQTGEMVLSRSQVQGMAQAPRGMDGSGGQSVVINVPIMAGGNGSGGGNNGPLLTQEDAQQMQKQFKAIADERIARATKYRGALNPG